MIAMNLVEERHFAHAVRLLVAWSSLPYRTPGRSDRLISLADLSQSARIIADHEWQAARIRPPSVLKCDDGADPEPCWRLVETKQISLMSVRRPMRA